MNWKQLMLDLLSAKTLQQVADECGLSSRGHAHDLSTGRQKTVSYEVGAKIISMHKRVMRKINKDG